MSKKIELRIKAKGKAEFLSEADIALGKEMLRRGGLELDHPPIKDLVAGELASRKAAKANLISVVVASLQDCLKTIQMGAVAATEESYREAGEPDGHFLYRFFRAQCGYAESKSSKLAAFVKVAFRKGISPNHLPEFMGDGWTIDKGYEEAKAFLSSSAFKNEDALEEKASVAEEGAASKRGANQNANCATSRATPQTKSNRVSRPADREIDIEAEEDHEGDASLIWKNPKGPDIEVCGEPDIYGPNRTAIALVQYGLRRRPVKITFISLAKAKRLAQKWSAAS